MKRDTIECPRCGRGITPEEAEIGITLSCPACEDTDEQESPSRRTKSPRTQKSRRNPPTTP